MKYGAHIFLWIERWDNSCLGLFVNAKNLGLDVLEIAVGDDVEFDAKAVKQAAQNSAMELVISPGGVWPADADLSLENPLKTKHAMDWHKYWIEQAAAAGATAYAGALYGHPGNVKKAAPQPEEFDRVRTNLRELAAFASDYNMKIVLEPMSHFRTHFLNTPKQAAELINAINHPNISVLFDTYHAVTEIRNFYENVKMLAGKLWGLHACENDRGCPGNGLIPWDDVFKGLDEINFDGYIGLESYNSAIRNGGFAYSRGMFHHVCNDGNEFVKQGITFLKEKVRSHY